MSEDDAPSVLTLRGVGPGVAARLRRLGIRTVADLLFHLPVRYQDRTRITAIGALRPGDETAVEAEVVHAQVLQRRRRSLLVGVSDGTGMLTLRFFHFNRSLQQSLPAGRRVHCFGDVRRGPASLEMIHPELRLGVDAVAPDPETHLTPVYPTTEGLPQRSLRKLIADALAALEQGRWPLAEHLPARCLPPGLRMDIRHALVALHRPPPDTDRRQIADGRSPARLRLAFEELLAQQLSMTRLRMAMRQHAAPAMDVPGELFARMTRALPFTLTDAQRRVIGEILDDLGRPLPMMRLVQGDVGSGKTVVAAAACLQAAEAHWQVAVMAPTELLAEQHYHSFRDWMAPLGLRVGWLSGQLGGTERARVREALASGEIDVVVGTHALFQEQVGFARLGLVVIDEQHRFGVHQRMALKEKGHRDGHAPHQLIMTATPIPRTLAMTAYADLDYSVIDELPPGRQPVRTVAVPDTRRDEVVSRVSQACATGQQAYWVCTLVEESEALQCQAAEDTAEALSQALPELSVGLVHGRMPARHKEAVMGAFRAGGIQLLVATTVIEVGVDVPNASLMIIENPERLGLAQLHQLRGRVGRGAAESSCVLMYHAPLSDNARRRLQALRETSDGFEIARTDLELRGPGEVLGTRQTGLLQLRIADIVHDQALLPEVTKTAQRLAVEHPELVDRLVRRWLGESDRFGQV